MEQSYSHIVVGAGALGTATAYWLARAGARKVLVLEQFQLGHPFGASEDHSRIIRHTYHNSSYALLTRAAYETWAEIEERSGVRLVHEVGCLHLAEAGSPGEQDLDCYRASLAVSRVGSEDLDARTIRQRWPQWEIGDDVVGLYQEEGGILDIRKANATHVALARALGVEFRSGTTVARLDSAESHVTVGTNHGTFRAESVVLCVASWLPCLLPQLGLDWPIVLSQEQVGYFVPAAVRDFAPDRFPVWAWHGDPLFYGFPMYGEVAVKLGRDMSGRFVTQETRSFEPDPAETERLAAFLHRRLPGAAGPELFSKTCVYDMPPDRDFILDHVPGQPRITVGIGAGHAAKFASLLGRILSDLATHGRTEHPIDAFRADRPALTDPEFGSALRLTASPSSAKGQDHA